MAENKGFYYALEDKYYALMEWFENKLHIPLMKYFVDPIESRGIPSMPIFVLALIAIIGVVGFFALPMFSTLGLKTTILDVQVMAGTAPLDGAYVTLLYNGAPFLSTNSVDGIASFENVPIRDGYSVRVEASGYTKFERQVALSEEPVSFTASLQAAGPGGIELPTPIPGAREYNFIVMVADNLGNPIESAVVDFSSPSPNGDTGSATTNAQGEAVLKLSTQEQILLIDAHADGYLDERKAARAKDGGVKVELTASGTSNFDSNGDNNGGAAGGDSGISPDSADVLVNARDDAGNGVSAKCTLYSANTTEVLDTDASEVGICSFVKSATVGESVYVQITPSDPTSFLPKTSDTRVVQEGRIMQFDVTLDSATPPSTQVINLTLKDEQGNAIPSANVNIYLLASNKLLSSSSTDESGAASFELSSAIAVTDMYVTAYADGFLPANAVLSKKEIALTMHAAITGNNADFAVRVKDDDAVPVSGATVILLDADGKVLGVPPATTDTAGMADFNTIPISIEVRARASSAPRVGDSDVFSLALGEEERIVEVFLAPATGTLKISVEDFATNKPIGALKATAKLAKDGTLEGSCSTDGNGSCVINDVVANKEIIVVVNGPDYVEFTSAPFAVPANNELDKNFQLIPVSLSNQTQVFVSEIRDEKGMDVTNLESLSKAGYYTVRVVANFPKGVEEQGIMLRVGDKPTAAEEQAYIVSYDYAPVGVAAPVGFASASYSPSGDGTQDLMNSDVSKGAKFAGVRFSGLAGSAELRARIFVKPTARTGTDKVNLYYRAWSRTGEVFSYEPTDSVLGNARKVADRDTLYANAKIVSYNIVDGALVCNDAGTACAALSFYSAENPVAVPSPFQATLGREFTVKYDLRVFGAFEASTAYVRLWNSDKTLKLKDYLGDGTAQKMSEYEQRVLLSSAKGNYSGTLTVSPVFPTQNARLLFEFGDGRGQILVNDRSSVIVQGTGRLTITDLTPASFAVGKRKDVSLRVLSATGTPIEDAKIAFEEMDEAEAGSPFAGSPPSPIVGDGTEDNGKDGVYRIAKVKTLAPGKFAIVASREGFKSVSAELASKTSEFFSYEPADGIEVECKGGTIKIKNLLDVNAPIDINVGPGTDAMPCVNITGPGVVRKLDRSPGAANTNGATHQYIPADTSAGAYVEALYHIENVKGGSTKTLKLTPTSSGDCTLTFSSSDARSGSNYAAEYEISNLCTAFNATGVSQVLNVTGYVLRAQNNVWVGPDGKSGPARLLIPAPNGTQGDNITATVWFTNLDAVPHNFYCRDRAKVNVVNISAQQFLPNSVVNYTFMRPGMFYCYLDNGDLAKIKVKSMCPHHGVNYYAGFMAACLFKENILKGTALGDIVNFGASAWEVAASIPTHFDAVSGTKIPMPNYPNPYLSTSTVAQYGAPVCGMQGQNYGSYPGMSGYAYNPQMQAATPGGQQVYYGQQGYGNTPVTMPQGMPQAQLATQCYGTGFQQQMNYAPPSTTTGAECKSTGNKITCTVHISPMLRSGGVPFVLDNVILDQMPYLRVQKKLYDSKSNDCFQLWDLDNNYGTKIGEALGKGFFQVTGFGAYPLARSFAVVFNPEDKDSCINYNYSGGKLTVEPVGGYEQEMKIGTGIGNELHVVLRVEPVKDDPMAPYYLTAVPAGGKVVARPYSGKDYSVEPYLFINNIPDRTVTFAYPTQAGEPAIATETAGSPTKATDQSVVLFAPKITDKQKIMVTQIKISGSSAPIKFSENNPFVKSGDATTTVSLTANDALKGGMQNLTALDVVGSVGSESDLVPAMQCSGTKFCLEEETKKAVDAIKTAAETAVKNSYSTMPFIYKRSFLDAQDLGFENCLDGLARELIADRASEAICKNFFNMCNNDQFDAEEEEIEEGESEGVNYGSITGAAGGAVKQVICQGTQFGQQVQGIESIFGNAQARNLIRQAFGRALGAGTFTTPAPTPLLDKISLPEFYFMLKKADPLGGGVEGTGLKLYHFKVKSIEDLLAAASKNTGWETVYEETGYVPGKQTEVQKIGSIPYRALKLVVGGLYNWARDAIAVSGKNRNFPFVWYTNNNYVVGFSEYPTLATLNKFVVIPFLEPLEGEKGTVLTDHDPLKIAKTFNALRGTAPSAATAATAVYVSSCDSSDGVVRDKSCLDANGEPMGEEAKKVVGEAFGLKPGYVLSVDGYFIIRLTGGDSWSSVPELKVMMKEPVLKTDGAVSVLEQVNETIKYFASESYVPADRKWPCNLTVTSPDEIVGFCPSRVAIAQGAVDLKAVEKKSTTKGCDYNLSTVLDVGTNTQRLTASFINFEVALKTDLFPSDFPAEVTFSEGPRKDLRYVFQPVIYDPYNLIQRSGPGDTGLLYGEGINFGKAGDQKSFGIIVKRSLSGYDESVWPKLDQGKWPVEGKNSFNVSIQYVSPANPKDVVLQTKNITVCVVPAQKAPTAPVTPPAGTTTPSAEGVKKMAVMTRDNDNVKDLPMPGDITIKFNTPNVPSSGGNITIDLGKCGVDCGIVATLVQIPKSDIDAPLWYWNNVSKAFFNAGQPAKMVYTFPPFSELKVEGIDPKKAPAGIQKDDGIFFELYVCRDGYVPMYSRTGHARNLPETRWNPVLWQYCRIAAYPDITKEELWKATEAPKVPAATSTTAPATAAPAAGATSASQKKRGESCTQNTDCSTGLTCATAAAACDYFVVTDSATNTGRYETVAKDSKICVATNSRASENDKCIQVSETTADECSKSANLYCDPDVVSGKPISTCTCRKTTASANKAQRGELCTTGSDCGSGLICVDALVNMPNPEPLTAGQTPNINAGTSVCIKSMVLPSGGLCIPLKGDSTECAAGLCKKNSNGAYVCS